MPEIVETAVYRADELDQPAQEKAREWFRSIGFDHDWYAFVYSDFERVCAILGIELRAVPVRLFGGGTRAKPGIWFSGFWSQGDGACFEGSYAYAKAAPAPFAPMRRTMPSFTTSPTRSRPCSGATSTSSAPISGIKAAITTNIQWRSTSSATIRPDRR